MKNIETGKYHSYPSHTRSLRGTLLTVFTSNLLKQTLPTTYLGKRAAKIRIFSTYQLTLRAT